MKFYRCILALLIILEFTACSKKTLPNNTSRYPKLVDTRDQQISFQVRKKYQFDNIIFDNDFDGARLNNVSKKSKNTFEVTISPENEPINDSPWYSFRVKSNKKDTVNISFNYGDYNHRYYPKISTNRVDWMPLDSSLIYITDDSLFAVKLPIDHNVTYVSAQELFTMVDLNRWVTDIKSDDRVSHSIIGKSSGLNPLHRIVISKNDYQNKPTLVFLSRQHPPEVTGQLALISFVNALLANPKSNVFFKKYNIVVYPMLNPDGVKEGNWRHNLNGVDLNRDWAMYNQQETKTIAEDLHRLKKNKSLTILLGIDFHSTWHDVYYTNVSDANTKLPGFTEEWLARIKKSIKNYQPKVAPSNIGRPVSKNWFFIDFNAVGITYEIGDETDRDFINRKSEISADRMIDILLEK